MRLKGKKILITGATGLLGGHLVEALIKGGAKVFTLSRNLDAQSYFVKSGLSKKSQNIKADILDLKNLEKVLKANKIEYVFHLAAQLKVVKLHETFGFNIMGVNNILEACRKSQSIKGIIITSSNRAYVESGLSSKEMKQLAQSPYDLSKTAADLVAQSYFKTYGLPVAICRFGNVYGPGDLYNRVVSLIIKNIIGGKTLELKKSQSKRSYVYAGDVARGLILAAENIQRLKGKAISFESKENFSVLDLVKRISEIVGKQCKYKVIGTMPSDIPMKKLNINPAQKVLKWKPEVGFNEGIKKTYDWYKNQLI